jgi:hypothetical protein
MARLQFAAALACSTIKVEGNLIFGQINLPPFINTPQFENGNLSNISGGTPSALAP